MNITRRDFVARGLGGTTLLASGVSLPGFLTRTAVAAPGADDERILVVIQLTGGNDGLNTVVPFRDDEYHKARPTLRIRADQVLKLTDELGLHPDMAGFKRLHDDGLLAVVNNVGYPNPDRSHFRSMDIWHTADARPEAVDSGWLGRVVDRGAGPSDVPRALHLDEGALPLALKNQRVAVPSLRNIDAFRLQGDTEDLQRVIGASRRDASDDLLFVQRLAVSSCANARRLERVGAGSAVSSPYPDYRLALRLRQIAQLIGARFGPRIYYTSLDGFDTHARQALAHGPLLRELSDSVTAFYDDLRQRRIADRVVVLTFSEFGRRVGENGSQGTDHGAAAPMFVMGPAVRAGVVGGRPDLTRLIDGDVRHECDFRRVYAGVLRDWLAVDPDSILGRRFDPLAIIRS